MALITQIYKRITTSLVYLMESFRTRIFSLNLCNPLLISVIREKDFSVTFDLVKLANMKMPFGKYSNWRLIDLPETYLIWFSHKGFPKGELGDMLRSVLEIKTNGLEHLLEPLKK